MSEHTLREEDETVECPCDCHAVGHPYPTHAKDCPQCKGTGRVPSDVERPIDVWEDPEIPDYWGWSQSGLLEHWNAPHWGGPYATHDLALAAARNALKARRIMSPL